MGNSYRRALMMAISSFSSPSQHPKYSATRKNVKHFTRGHTAYSNPHFRLKNNILANN